MVDDLVLEILKKLQTDVEKIDRLVEFDSLPPGRSDGDEDDDKQAKRGDWRHLRC